MALPQWRVDKIESREGSPLDNLIAAEAQGRDDKHVTVFLTGCLPWDNVIRTCCPVCKNLPKPPGWYCGRCDTPKGTLARKGAIGVTEKPIKVIGGKRAKAKPETRKEKRAKKQREAA